LPRDDRHACLERIKELWVELERTPRRTPAYEELVARIRAEADLYRQMMDKKQGAMGD
jgi:hypothetical protein